jgi:hypothetical protein
MRATCLYLLPISGSNRPIALAGANTGQARRDLDQARAMDREAALLFLQRRGFRTV